MASSVLVLPVYPFIGWKSTFQSRNCFFLRFFSMTEKLKTDFQLFWCYQVWNHAIMHRCWVTHSLPSRLLLVCNMFACLHACSYTNLGLFVWSPARTLCAYDFGLNLHSWNDSLDSETSCTVCCNCLEGACFVAIGSCWWLVGVPTTLIFAVVAFWMPFLLLCTFEQAFPPLSVWHADLQTWCGQHQMREPRQRAVTKELAPSDLRVTVPDLVERSGFTFKSL